ncbi:MAG: hypothetical protein AAF804_10805 [Bacteroidota bacterium]
MKQSTQRTIFFLSLTLSLALAIFWGSRAHTYQNQLEGLRRDPQVIQDSIKMAWFQRLLAVDSLMLLGRPVEAQKVFDSLSQAAASFPELSAAVSFRKQNFNRVLQLQSRLNLFEGKDSYQEMAESLVDKRVQIDSLAERLSYARRQQNTQLDSMAFALEKAEMRTEILRTQLANKASLGYLTFSDRKGEKVHYVGEISQAQAQGWGIGITESGIRYEGEWQRNRKHGEGVLHWPDKEYYKGQFVQGQRQGQGNYYWPDGEMFSGEWENDQRNGRGVFYGKDGEIMAQGFWENNKFRKANRE